MLFYASVTTKAVLGIAQVTRAAFPDPTAKEGDWAAVELEPVKPLARAVALEEIKGEKTLAKMVLLHNSRLSVQPVTRPEFERIVKLGQ